MARTPDNPKNDGDFSDKTQVMVGDAKTLHWEREKAKEQKACLIIIRGKPQGHRFFLTHEEMYVGRDPACEIALSDPNISRKHAKITHGGEGTIVLEDLGSSNGTYVNDRKVASGSPVVLAKEDMVKLGSFILKFLPAGELEILFYGNLGSAAHTDPLTQTYNKRYLLEALESEFDRASALRSDFSIVFMDLDHFKQVNDTHGHEAGDVVLKEFTSLVRNDHIRPKDVFARYGGEEFVVLMNASAQVAAAFAESVRAAVEAHAFMYEGKRIPVTSSLGVAALTPDIESAQALLKAADKALFSAKEGGRNRVVVSA